jgi:hypothetical protein
MPKHTGQFHFSANTFNVMNRQKCDNLTTIHREQINNLLE